MFGVAVWHGILVWFTHGFIIVEDFRLHCYFGFRVRRIGRYAVGILEIQRKDGIHN